MLAEAGPSRTATAPSGPGDRTLNRAGTSASSGTASGCWRGPGDGSAAVAHAPDDCRSRRRRRDRAADWRGSSAAARGRGVATPGAARRVAPSPSQVARSSARNCGPSGRPPPGEASSGRTPADRPAGGVLRRLRPDSLRSARPDADVAPADMQITTVHLLSSGCTNRTRSPCGSPCDGGPRHRRPLNRGVPAVADPDGRDGAPERLGADPGAAAAGMTEAEQAASGRSRYPELLGIDDLASLARSCGAGGERDFLRVPIGIDDQGAPVLLDLKESAELGMGPHGCVSARPAPARARCCAPSCWPWGLPSTGGPGMVLVDYKGGAAFAPFAAAACRRVITNLARPRRARRTRPRPASPVRSTAASRLLKDAVDRIRESGTTRSCATGAPRPGADAAPVRRDRRVRRTAHRRTRLHRPVPLHRPDRPVDRGPPAAVQPADRGRQAPRPGHLPLLPDRAADLLRAESTHRARHPRRLPLPRSPATATSRSTPRRTPLPVRIRLRARPRRRTGRRRGRAVGRPMLLPTIQHPAGGDGRPSAADRTRTDRAVGSAGRWWPSASTGSGPVPPTAPSRRSGCRRCRPGWRCPG